ncbi:uncharacterized protein LOC124174771 [Neodiprion fabricii]|uniref:uncharacterized protein LOC124174771 n=1 Tax=Neodiprion fabricii TaxID=2872261 RepID=UPI001ED932BB|nr:uncharacterized protein LOC124174771 [Neodiprion fabricii]
MRFAIALFCLELTARCSLGTLEHGKTAPQEPVLINFRRVANTSREIAPVYLPPKPVGDPLLPEVVDNRALATPPVIIDSVTSIDLSTTWPTTRTDLQTPREDVAREGRYFLHPYAGRIGQRSNFKSTLKLGAGARISEAIKVNDMSCHYSGQDLYFRASLTALKDTDHPLIDAISNDVCKIVKVKGEYRLRFEKENFWNCGVTDCSTDLGTFFCLTVRFPTISGLRLKDDTTITLQCKTQDKTASHTTQINVKTLNTAARMAPRVAAGGLKNAFQTDIGLFRKSYNSENVFDVKILPGGTVVLGEEILLRALVRDGDGWKYSRIGEVSVQYIEARQQQRVMNSLWILDAEGCRNPEIPEISPSGQYRVAPLESYLVFQAFMFENMKETDEMVVSVKVMGCLEGEDCSLNCPKEHTRRARSPTGLDTDAKANVTDWQSDIAFKVVKRAPENDSRTYRPDDAQLIVPYVLTVFVLVISVGLLCVVKTLLKQRSVTRK